LAQLVIAALFYAAPGGGVNSAVRLSLAPPERDRENHGPVESRAGNRLSCRIARPTKILERATELVIPPQAMPL
jgi:hypothetical protein